MTVQEIYSERTIELISASYPHQKNKFIIFEPLTHHFNDKLENSFNCLVREIHQMIGKRRSSKHDSNLKCHIEQVLLNLIKSLSSISYLGIYGNKNSYPLEFECELSSSHHCQFTHHYISLVLENLMPEYLYKERGYMFTPEFDIGLTKDVTTGMNKYYPKPDLIQKLVPFLYLTGSSFNIPKTQLAYINIKEIDSKQQITKTTKRYSKNTQLKQDRDNLKIINDYLSKQNFPLKAPIKRVYSENKERGGRLYTSIQNIPNRRLPIRRTLKINGGQLIELDFKANHLSMCIALYENYQELPVDPYIELLKETNIDKTSYKKYRELAKAFVTRSLGSSSIQGAMGSFREWQTKQAFTEGYIDNTNLFRQLRTAFEKLFPNTKLFSDLGASIQKLEGDILMQVLLEGVSKDIPILPLHDAALCEEKHIEDVKGMLQRHWSAILKTNHKPFVEVKS